ncbi:MAG: Phosphate transport system permease protein PstA [Frankiales bacterium]|nr:Phosphate transport system permease protein PstA [Frankiales bacterium]
MTTLTALRPTRSVSTAALYGLGTVSVLAALGLVRGAGSSSTALTVVVTGLAYLLLAFALVLAVEGRRAAVDRTFTNLAWGSFLLALVPLVSVIALVVKNGSRRFDANFLTHSLRGIGPRDSNGGAYHAILGTLEQVGLASLIAIPLGLLAAIYVVEHGRGWLVSAVRFVTDVMTGVPSIVAGLFVFTFWVLALGRGFSGFAASLALAILMLPTVVRTTEVVLGLVPDSLREASLALGVSRWKMVLRVVLPTAASGITTGIVLAIARVTGETAPLLLTALNFDSINSNPFKGQQAGLPSFVFAQAGQPQQAAVDRAWAGALTLLLLVLLLNLVARLIARRTRLKD